MKKSLLILSFIFFITSFANASHVVGGDFHIQWVSQNNYHIKLRAYRDDVNGIGMPGTITVGIYQIGTNVQVATQVLTQTSLGLVPLGDPCYTPDPNVVRIEEGIFESPANLFLPDFAPGYYVQAQINARNSLAINVQTGGTMSWFAMIPDPAIGQNSSPDFGNYPNDAYFCITGPKMFQYPITDADGDSLAYSLVQPLDAATPSNGTFAGVGAYPYYPGLSWQGGYNLANIVGGTTPMSINPITGMITAAPTSLGFFTFAIRVEEFRDTTGTGVKVKIGETRRDVQYISLNCTSGNPPQFLNSVPQMNQTIPIAYNKLYCKDLIFDDINATDTLYIELLSPMIDSGWAYTVTPNPDMSGNYHYYYNWNGANWTDSVVTPPNQTDTIGDYNIGTIATRFCVTPHCEIIDSIFEFQVNAFSLGCDGKTQDSMIFYLHVVPPVVDFKDPGNGIAMFGEEYCQNIVFRDTSIVDLLNIEVSSDIFNEGAEYPDLATNYEYNNWAYTAPHNQLTTGVANNAANTVNLGTRFCWTPDCEHIGKVYNVQAILSSVDCPEGIQDTIDFDIEVAPPFDSLDVIPNVFTPNGDGFNDVYTLGYTDANGLRVGGTSNPCHDVVKVQIFNRWGLLIYESEEYPEFEWDGKNKSGNVVPAGTYFVLINGTYGNETITLDQRSVTVMDPK